ncbi:dephospho-CoA kinase [Cuneatibacter sp. NSJ-177]|uniref:dephospho-CoA kinase n=1 Tax=Cuneatibacter sp. NSJ-177 TaxID=2931401 RepID=UPI001FD59677|nr:dephospho-CoA kinase [Cuneatibacter sp. NSJ-177]MCJ7835998.1 dephospho-CoA kinase [Cuneatibacter sp. NSJ-177]
MRVIGITGGVGSGKSAVLEVLKQDYGACVIQADLVARKLMEPGGASYEAVVKAFGPAILNGDAEIDRPKLAEMIFSDEKKRRLLNSLTHPLVEAELRRRVLDNPERLVVLEAALPNEAGFRTMCESVWYIHAPEPVRIARLQRDRGYSEEKCREIMRSQFSETEFRKVSDVVIENGGSLEETRAQIQKIMDCGNG